MNDRLAVFCESALFRGLSTETLEKLTALGHVRRYGRGSIICMPADPATELYVIYTGSVSILLTSSDGREMIVDELKRGDSIGELALITRQPHAIMAVAHEHCEVLALPTAALYPLIECDPDFLAALLQRVAGQLAVSLRREEALAFLSAPARIARVLRLLQERLTPDDVGYITISQEEIARRTGLTRQTVAACLGRWRRLGWLLTGRGRIVLLNLTALANIENQPLL